MQANRRGVNNMGPDRVCPWGSPFRLRSGFQPLQATSSPASPFAASVGNGINNSGRAFKRVALKTAEVANAGK
jgi:hypothetical protein